LYEEVNIRFKYVMFSAITLYRPEGSYDLWGTCCIHLQSTLKIQVRLKW